MEPFLEGIYSRCRKSMEFQPNPRFSCSSRNTACGDLQGMLCSSRNTACGHYHSFINWNLTWLHIRHMPYMLHISLRLGDPHAIFFSARPGYSPEIPCIFECIRNHQIAFKSSGYANMRPPQACKAKSQQPSRNPRFALDPLLFAYQGIQWNSIGFLGFLSPLQQPRKYR